MNFAAVQQENAAAFEWAMRTGAGIVIVQVATDVGMRFVAWTYNKVKKRWQPDVENAPQGETQQLCFVLPDKLVEEVSLLRRGQLVERFDEVQGEVSAQWAPEDAGWAQAGHGGEQPVQQQAAAQQQPSSSITMAVGHPTQLQFAIRQVQRVEAGQPLLPVDDHGISYDNDHDHNQADDRTKVAIERVHKGKGTLEQPIGDTWYDNNNDPWQTQKQRMMKAMKDLKAEIAELKAHAFNNKIVAATNKQTPMVKNIGTPLIGHMSSDEHVDFDVIDKIRIMEDI